MKTNVLTENLVQSIVGDLPPLPEKITSVEELETLLSAPLPVWVRPMTKEEAEPTPKP